MKNFLIPFAFAIFFTAVGAVIFFTAVGAVSAQTPPPDPATLQRALSILEQQRNNAMNSAAACEVKAAGLSEELTKAKSEVARLKEKYEPEVKKPETTKK